MSATTETIPSKFEEISLFQTELDKEDSPVDSETFARLAELECWSSFYSYLDKKMARNDCNLDLKTFILYLQAKILYQGSPEETEYCLSRMLSLHQLSYENFHQKVMPHILVPRDYYTESVILKLLVKLFSNTKEKVYALERLSLLYAKRLHDEDEVEKINRQILNLDSNYTSALKFFKNLHAQRGEWEEACSYLEKLVFSEKITEHKNRLVQELASTLLYQLEKSKECLDVLKKHLSSDHIGAEGLIFQANSKLSDWNGCLEILHKELEISPEHGKKAVIHFRLAEIYQLTEQPDKIIENLDLALSYNINFFQAHTKKIEQLARSHNWSKCSDAIVQFKSICQDPKSINLINDLQIQLAKAV